MRLKTAGTWTSIVLMEGFAEVENNKVTILCNGAEEASSIDLKFAQEELEKVTLLVDKATTKKETIEVQPASDFKRITPISNAVKSGA
jgi:F-type H+-transporting ATPase subunit epsilon